jgi:hypothetical protein
MTYDQPNETDPGDTIELFVHRPTEERIEIREIKRTITVAEAVDLADGERVWLEETETEIDTTITVIEANLGHHGHVHVNRCHEVVTSVTYNGATKERTFHPATRIERVFEWAVSKHGFNLTPADATEHVLQLTGTTIQPDVHDHIGSFVGEHCSVSFGLVPKIRPQG